LPAQFPVIWREFGDCLIAAGSGWPGTTYMYSRLFVHGCTYVAEHMDVQERPAANVKTDHEFMGQQWDGPGVRSRIHIEE
jgi:hypothetical protein